MWSDDATAGTMAAAWFLKVRCRKGVLTEIKPEEFEWAEELVRGFANIYATPKDGWFYGSVLGRDTPVKEYKCWWRTNTSEVSVSSRAL